MAREPQPKTKLKTKIKKSRLEVGQITIVEPTRPRNPDLPKNYYFDNDYVEELLTEYVKGGCTDISLRDKIMLNASELIRQIIRTHKLHTLTNGKEGTAFGDLYQLAWCVSPDTLMFTRKGIKPISDLCGPNKIGEINEEVFGLNGPGKAIRFIKKDSGAVKNIKTKFGYKITATGDHPFFVLTPDGPVWKKTEALEIGDFLAVQSNQHYFNSDNTIDYNSESNGGNTNIWNPPPQMTKELAYIIGLIISEGSIEKHRVIIYNINSEVHNILNQNNLGLKFRVNKKYGYTVVNSVCFVRYLDSIGLGPEIKSWTKIIPDCLLRCSENIIASLIKGMFDGDGHSNKRIGAVGYTSSSLKLIETLKVLLLNFGIVTRMSTSNRRKTIFNHKEKFRNRKLQRRESKVRASYQLLLRTFDSRIFYDLIGFEIAYKTKKKKFLPESLIKLDKYVISHFQNLFEVSGKTKYWYKKYCKYDIRQLLNKKWCTLKVASRALSLFEDLSSHESFHYIKDRIKEKSSIDCRITWLPIESIIDDVSETICLRVEPSNTFTANGFITHNCQIESSLYKFDGRPGHTKVFNMWCVSPDTMLMTDHGIDTIGHMLYTGSGINDRVYGLDGLNELTATLCRSETPTLKIKTRLGYQIESTPEHRFRVLKDENPEWVEAGKLRPGDLVGIQYGQNLFANNNSLDDIVLQKPGSWNPPSEMTDELAYIIGLYIAEGFWSYNKLVIYNIDQDVVDNLVNNQLGLNFIHEPQFQRVSLCNVRFIEFMQALGFIDNDKAALKRITDRLLSCSKSIIKNLIKGMFDGNGHASEFNGQVGYTSTSLLLINQLRMLLLNFGFLSKLSIGKRTKSKFGNKITQHKLGFQLNLSTNDSKKFYETIGFGIKRKALKSKCLKHNKTEIFGLIPYFRKLKENYGCGMLGYNKIRPIIKNGNGVCFLEQAELSLKNWSRWSDDKNYKFILERIKERTRNHNNIVWLPIVSVEESSSPVCEITVDSPNHSYIANGFISHNSQVAKTVMLAHIKKESRDKRNYGAYKEHLDGKHQPASFKFERFLIEARNICQFSDTHLSIVEAIEELYQKDDKPFEGLIDKLVKRSGIPRSKVSGFLRMVRLRAFEFSDSPVNNNPEQSENKYRVIRANNENEDD